LSREIRANTRKNRVKNACGTPRAGAFTMLAFTITGQQAKRTVSLRVHPPWIAAKGASPIHAYHLTSGCRRALGRKQVARPGAIHKLAHGHWFSHYRVLQHACGNAAKAIGFAAVVAESELIGTGFAGAWR